MCNVLVEKETPMQMIVGEEERPSIPPADAARMEKVQRFMEEIENDPNRLGLPGGIDDRTEVGS